eukprot:4486189-Amphidinium_carterae.1
MVVFSAAVVLTERGQPRHDPELCRSLLHTSDGLLRWVLYNSCGRRAMRACLWTALPPPHQIKEAQSGIEAVAFSIFQCWLPVDSQEPACGGGSAGRGG